MIKKLLKNIRNIKLVKILLIQPQSIKHIFRVYAESFLIALTAALILRVFILSTYKVSTPVLSPILSVGDYVLSFKLPFSLPLTANLKKKGNVRFINSNDLIIYSCLENTDNSCLGRVIGTPGELVDPDYQSRLTNYPLDRVEEGYVMIFQKNQLKAKGEAKLIPVDYVEGKPFFIWLSLRVNNKLQAESEGVVNWSRLMTFL